MVFKIIGGGSKLDLLKNEIGPELAATVKFYAPMGRDFLLEEYKTANVLLMHLNDFEAFKKVLPSKTFEYAATGKPIIAGVNGYASKFLENYVDGALIFTPCDVDEMLAAIDKALEGRSLFNRNEFHTKFSREDISQRMARSILSVHRNS